MPNINLSDVDGVRPQFWRAAKAHRGTQFCISCEQSIAKGQTYYQIIDEDSEIMRLCTNCFYKPANPFIHLEPSFESITVEDTTTIVTVKLDSTINPDRYNYDGPGSKLSSQ